MERLPVSSSNIATVGYDPNTMILEIEFQTGSVYQYKNVPQSVYSELIHSSSCGAYFDSEIRNIYQYERIT